MQSDKFPTLKSVYASHPLARAVIRQLGGGQNAISCARGAASHGADSGFNGFTYYTDTAAFTKRNRKAIRQAVTEKAVDLGETPIALVRGFRCLKDQVSDMEVSAALTGGKAFDGDATDVVDNALAWLALVEVGLAIIRLQEGV